MHARHGTGRSCVSFKFVSFKFKCHTDRRCGSRVLRVDPTQAARLNCNLFPPPKVFFSRCCLSVHQSVFDARPLSLSTRSCLSLHLLVLLQYAREKVSLLSLAPIIVGESRTIAKKPPRPAFTDGAVHFTRDGDEDSSFTGDGGSSFTRPGSSRGHVQQSRSAFARPRCSYAVHC